MRLGKQPSLAHKASGVATRMMQELECDRFAGCAIDRAIDVAHPAASDSALEFEPVRYDIASEHAASILAMLRTDRTSDQQVGVVVSSFPRSRGSSPSKIQPSIPVYASLVNWI